jgi:hypothetical protein
MLPAAVRFGVRPARSAWSAVYTRQRQQVSHFADRLTVSLALPPCGPADGGRREAWLNYLAAESPWVRLRHFVRPVPMGTLRGTLTVAAEAVAGLRSVTLNTGQPGATLLGGDVLGAGGRLLPVAYAGAVADGSGVMIVPLQVPLRATLAAGSAVTWSQPTGAFQFEGDGLELDYSPGLLQRGVDLQFVEVV